MNFLIEKSLKSKLPYSLIILGIFNSCIIRDKRNLTNQDDSTHNKLKNAMLLIDQIESYDSAFISFDCFELNKITIRNKEQYFFGDQYFCNKNSYDLDSSNMIFSNGLAKINGEIQILQKIYLENSNEDFFINKNYLIKSATSSDLEGKHLLRIYDLNQKKQCSHQYYFRWYCEL